VTILFEPWQWRYSTCMNINSGGLKLAKISAVGILAMAVIADF
jgi:hypothetical protein